MRRRLKRTTSQYIIVSIISVVIIGAAFLLLYFTVIRNMKIDYKKQISLLTNELETHKVYVYEAKADIPAGSKITEDKLKYIQAYSNQSLGCYMGKKDVGKIALIDITSGTQILKGMLTEDNFDSNDREVEYNTIHINDNLKENDVVDIRLMLPNGEDYIVLSKKKLRNLSLEERKCFLWLTEEEILNMSSAIVDAYLYSGSKLYTTTYIEPTLQDESIPTYQPSVSTLTLIKQDKNIVERASSELSKQLRREMEERLESFSEDSNSDNRSIQPESNRITEDNNKSNYVQPSDEENQTTKDYLSPDESLEEEQVEYGG